MEELRNKETSAARFQQFQGKNFRELTPTCSAGTLSTFRQKNNIFSNCWSFIALAIGYSLTATAYRRAKATFTVCYPCRDAASWSLTGCPRGRDPVGQTGSGRSCAKTPACWRAVHIEFRKYPSFVLELLMWTDTKKWWLYKIRKAGDRRGHWQTYNLWCEAFQTPTVVRHIWTYNNLKLPPLNVA